MGLKHHTIIVVPHTRARFRKWRVTNRQLAIGLALLATGVVVSGFTTWSFFTKSVDKLQLSKLADENRQLRDANQQFETDIRELKGQLSGFEERTRQLAIVAGLDGSSTDQEAGIGGDTAYGLNGPESDLASLKFDTARITQDLDQVDKLLKERSRRYLATPSISPVRGMLTSGYGYREDPITGKRSLHRAIDISTSPGQPVFAPADGIVLRAERAGRLGNSISLSHGFGYSTRYGHLSKIAVEAGQKVSRGDVIGYVGNTGRTTGYHLHYEIKLDGRSVNPLAFIVDDISRRS
jgi:murein DD-endopeptidase MepM/ murein hydrolase activator NlpD